MTPHQEITLHLGDVLARIPPQFLKPGPHNSRHELHFAMDDLSQDIARGRASVPLSQIAKCCPEIFRGELGLADDIQVPLPLQKLVEQIEVPTLPRRAFWKKPELRRAPPAANTNNAITFPAAPTAEKETAVLPLPEPVPAAPAPAVPRRLASISLNLCAIFRLLPSTVVAHAFMPDEHARVVLPLALIEPQLATGHVEIPLADFASALPAKIAAVLNTEVDEKVWIPLDEILQNLPLEHSLSFGNMEWPAAEEIDAPEKGSLEAPPAEDSAESIPAPWEEMAAVAKPEAEKSVIETLVQLPEILAAAAVTGEEVVTSENFPIEIPRETLAPQLRALCQAAADLAGALGWQNRITFPCRDFSWSVCASGRGFILALHRAPLTALAEEKLRAATAL